MRIGIDARFYGSLGKGLGRYTERLIEGLEELDTEQTYVVFLRRENFSEYRPKSDRFVKVLADYAWYSFAEQLWFPWKIWRERVDLMHFPHFNVPIFCPGRFVVTIHDLILLRYPTLRNTTRTPWKYWMKFACYRVAIWTACRRAGAVITVSRFTEQDLLREFPFLRGKISITLEGASRSCAVVTDTVASSVLARCGLLKSDVGHQKEVRLSPRDILQPYFLYVGNAYPHKYLESIGEMALRHPDYRFILVGREDFFYRRLRQQFMLTNLCFVGFLSDAELSVLYRFGTAYVFPSLYEGFGLPPLEAMSYGLPVLASCRGSLPEILGDAALFFDPEQFDVFSSQLDVLAVDTELRAKLRAKGYAHIQSFDWGRMARQTWRVYASVAKR